MKIREMTKKEYEEYSNFVDDFFDNPLPIGMQTYTFTDRKPCPHKNGWHVTFRIWFLKRRAMVCSDCGEVIYK